ncbi:MAG TPA: M81 family metallopeptidase [Thermodesulfobacteriota bacterium]|nr:M81 family metallopeptidase [Thermodesulfobacteriota bacterium]
MKRRVLSAEINHETNTFSILPTTLERYKARRYYRGPEIQTAFAGTRSEMGAHLDAAKRYGWELVQPIAAAATPGGRTPAKDWAHLKTAVTDACTEGRFDGILLALHGAMATEDRHDAEGDLLREVREKVGPEVPIAITLDLHGNVSDSMAALSNVVIAYRTYPHVDQYERAMEAAGLLQRAMDGEIQPRCMTLRAPVLDGLDYGRTQGGPMSRMLERAERLRESNPGILAVAVCAGFVWADVPDAGPSVTITADGEPLRFAAAAEELVREIRETKEEKSVRLYTLKEAMVEAARGRRGERPLILADFTDNPGSGGYGDGVRLLEAMIDAGLTDAVFGCVADGQAAALCTRAGAGAEIELELGAKVDPGAYGPPIKVKGVVERISDGAFTCEGPMSRGVKFSLGPAAVLRCGGVRVVVCTHNTQVYDLQVFKSQGIDPAAHSVVGVKSWHHFRAAFEPISRGVILADSGGLASMDLKRFTYQNVRRPVWPLDG